jgi:hypothetical protein
MDFVSFRHALLLSAWDDHPTRRGDQGRPNEVHQSRIGGSGLLPNAAGGRTWPGHQDSTAEDGSMANELRGRRIAFMIANEGIEQVELTKPSQAVPDAGGTPQLLCPEESKAQRSTTSTWRTFSR